jgi:hypothetical protein
MRNDTMVDFCNQKLRPKIKIFILSQVMSHMHSVSSRHGLIELLACYLVRDKPPEEIDGGNDIIYSVWCNYCSMLTKHGVVMNDYN